MITKGTLLIEKGTPVPQLFRIGTELYPNSWMPVTTNQNNYDFETELTTAGWTFFYMKSDT